MATAIPLFAGREISESMTDEVRQILGGEWISVGVSASEVSGEDVTAVFGVQWSFDNVTWATAQPDNVVGTLSSAGAVVQRFTVKAPYWRLVVEVTGTEPRLLCTANALI